MGFGIERWSASWTTGCTFLAATLVAVVGCGGGGGGGGTRALQGEAAVEAAAGVAVSTIIALAEFWPTSPGPEEADPCADGGQGRTTCDVTGDQSHWETSLSSCRRFLPEMGVTIFTDGNYAYVVDDPYACTEGLPDGAPVTLDVRDYTQRAVDDGGNELSRFSGHYIQTTTLRGEGCAGLNDTRVLDGTMQHRFVTAGLDIEITADQLTIDVDSYGEPCAVRVSPNGRLAVADHANGRRFGQIFGNAQVTFQEGFAAIDGDIANDCIGNAVFETLEPLYTDRLDECPIAGFIRVSFVDGARATVRFTDSGGVEIDYDDDGHPDKVAASCHDAALAECGG
jgi:hypothetical protein